MSAIYLPMFPPGLQESQAQLEGLAWDFSLSQITDMARMGNFSHSGTDQGYLSGAQTKASPPELKFVTTTGPPSVRSKESRLVVRSHAMQAFLREKKTEGTGAARRGPEIQTQTLDDSIGKFKLASWSRKSSKKASSTAKTKKRPGGDEGGHFAVSTSRGPKIVGRVPSLQTGLGGLDPFGILPITLTSRTRSLLHHYATSFTMNSVAVNPEGSWMALALTDAALLHATLSLVAYHHDLTHGREASLECLYQKGEAIREIHKRIGDSDRQFSDTSVGTVSLFTNLETMSGTRQISDVHMNALEKMIEVRGGLNNFRHNKVLHRVLTWADILYSSTWNCPPRFPFLESFRNDNHIGNLSRFSSTPDGYLPDNDDAYSWCRSSPDMYHVLEMLRRISTAVVSPDLDTADRAAISDRIYVLSHQLLSSQLATEARDSPPYASSSSSSSPPYFFDSPPIYSAYDPDLDNNNNFLVNDDESPDLSEPFRIAALLYLHLILRELPPSAKMHNRIVTSLKFALEERASIILRPSSRTALALLTWIFFLGATGASDPQERSYFVNLLGHARRGMWFIQVEEFEALLSSVAWRGGDLGRGYVMGIWREMGM